MAFADMLCHVFHVGGRGGGFRGGRGGGRGGFGGGYNDGPPDEVVGQLLCIGRDSVLDPCD